MRRSKQMPYHTPLISPNEITKRTKPKRQSQNRFLHTVLCFDINSFFFFAAIVEHGLELDSILSNHGNGRHVRICHHSPHTCLFIHHSMHDGMCMRSCVSVYCEHESRNHGECAGNTCCACDHASPFSHTSHMAHIANRQFFFFRINLKSIKCKWAFACRLLQGRNCFDELRIGVLPLFSQSNARRPAHECLANAFLDIFIYAEKLFWLMRARNHNRFEFLYGIRFHIIDIGMIMTKSNL